MNWNKLLTVLLCFFLLQACKKEVADANSKLNGNLLLHFDNKAGNNDLTLNADTLKNALGQDFVVSKFNYYISNIQLLNKDGSTYTYPQNESYFLVKESDKTTQEIQLNNIPEGDYEGLRFTIGVDSLKSVSKIADRTGVLDPTGGGADMYWGWNSGYIFLKLEGNSSFAPVLDSSTMERPIEYHIGLFGLNGATNNLKTITIPFNGSVAAVRQNKANIPTVHLFADALKVLSGSSSIDFTIESTILSDKNSINIANNYQHMFSLDYIQY